MRVRLALIVAGCCLQLGNTPEAQADPYLVASTGINRQPIWTPDGQAIIFASNRSGSWSLYRINVDGSGLTRLTFEGDQNEADISPDGQSLVFLQGVADPPSGLMVHAGVFVMPIGGGPATVIVPDIGTSLREPTWTPNGQEIYFSRPVEDNWIIYRTPSAGGPVTPVVDVGAFDIMSSFSPDGSHFLFSATGPQGTYNLYETAVVDPTNYSQITFYDRNTSLPHYHPARPEIVFSSRFANGDLELFTKDLVSGIVNRLTYDGDGAPDPRSQFARYSPDGTQIVFSSARLTGSENIWILPLDGSSPLSNRLQVGDGFGQAGGPVTIPVSLESSRSVAVLDFRVQDVPDQLTVTGVTVRGRATGMTASFSDDHDLHVLVYSLAGGLIPPGVGAILDLEVELSGHVSEGDLISLDPVDLVMVDAAGDPVEVTGVSGTFEVGNLPGDINGDNRVDVGDVIRLIEIILGEPPNPSQSEIAQADCYEDGTLNGLDLFCLIQTILQGPEQSADPGTVAPLEPLEFHVLEEVRGIQIWNDREHEVTAGVDLAPFEAHVSTDGRSWMAFDPAGAGWLPGDRVPVESTGGIRTIRAYGPGGREIPVSVSGNTVTIGTRGSGLRALPPGANPFRGGTDIRFRTAGAGPVSVDIFDIRGRLVSGIAARPVEAGDHAWHWDAIDRTGRGLPSGLYFAVVRAGKATATVRLTHLGN